MSWGGTAGLSGLNGLLGINPQREEPGRTGAYGGMYRWPGGGQDTSNWRNYYGFLGDDYAGSAISQASGEAGGTAIGAIRDGDTGFGGGDLRRARRAGYTAHSIMKYLMGDDMVGRDGKFFQEGGTDIGQEAINDLRGQLQIEQSMKNAYHNQMKVRQEYDKRFKDYDEQLRQTAEDARKAMEFKQSHAVHGGNEMGIQAAQSPASIAGMVGRGLGASFGRRSTNLKSGGLNIGTSGGIK